MQAVRAVNLQWTLHFLVAAILGYEGSVGVRSGCCCAHLYVVHLLGLTAEESRTGHARMLGVDKSNMPRIARNVV